MIAYSYLVIILYLPGMIAYSYLVIISFYIDFV